MALRSGYKGFKKLLPGLKLFRPGTLGIDNDVLIPELNKHFFPRSEQAVLGASNLVDFKKTVNISQSVVTLTSDGFTVSGSDTYISSKTPLQNLEVGKTYYASVKIDAFTSTDARFALRSSNNAIKKSVTLTGKGKYSFDFTYADGDYLSILASMETSQTCSITVSELQLSLSPNTPYAPYAMTNKGLTDKKWNNEPILLTSEDDLDDIKSPGLYGWGNSIPSNAPPEGYCALEVFSDGTLIYHRITKVSDNACRIYLRRFYQSWASFFKLEGTIVS